MATNFVKFKHFETLSAFNNSTIAEGDLCFIAEDLSIRTHSEVYMCSKDVKDIVNDSDSGLTISYNDGTSKTVILKGNFLELSNNYVENSSETVSGLTVAAGDTIDTAIGKLAKLISVNSQVTAAALNDLNSRLGDLDGDFVTETELAEAVSNLEDADSALDSRLDAIEAGYVKSVKGASGSGSATGFSVTVGPTTATANNVNLTVSVDDSALETFINQKTAGLWHFKGTVATVSALPLSGNNEGDVYHVNENGGEYAWNGTSWVELGSVIDLSAYQVKSVDTTADNGVSLSLTNGAVKVNVSEGSVTNGNTSVVTGDAVYDAIEAAKTALKGDATTSGDTLGELEDRIETLEGAGFVKSVTEGTSTENYVVLTVTDGDDAKVSINDSALKTKIDAIDTESATHIKNIKVNNVNGTVTNQIASVTITGADTAIGTFTAPTGSTVIANPAITSSTTINTAIQNLAYLTTWYEGS